MSIFSTFLSKSLIIKANDSLYEFSERAGAFTFAKIVLNLVFEPRVVAEDEGLLVPDKMQGDSAGFCSVKREGFHLFETLQLSFNCGNSIGIPKGLVDILEKA